MANCLPLKKTSSLLCVNCGSPRSRRHANQNKSGLCVDCARRANGHKKKVNVQHLSRYYRRSVRKSRI